MLTTYTEDYLLDKKVKIFQPENGYRTSSDAVLLAALAADLPEHARVLDTGSGTGSVSLCLAYRFKNRGISVDGLEIQPELTELANFSATQNGFDFVHFHNLDIRVKNTFPAPCSFDAVFTNPPYSDHDQPSPNRSKAAAHNHADFTLTQWLKFCLKMTKPFGKIYIIHRSEALQEICTAFAGFAGNLAILPVYSKKGQQAKRILVAAQKDSRTPCRILQPFVMHDKNGNYTADAQKILRDGAGFCALNNYFK